MTNPHYHIKSSEAPSGDFSRHLSVQIDTNGLTVLHLADDRPVELQYFRLDASNDDQFFSDIRELLAELAKGMVKNVVINWPESSLVPDELFTPQAGEEIINLMHGDLNKGNVSNDHIADWNLHNVYRIPAEMHDMLKQILPETNIKHFNSPWLSSVSPNTESDVIHLIIHPSHFLVLIFKESKLQILQRFVYEADEDLMFFLLSLCRELSIDPATIRVSASGFILADSSLYASLAQVFPMLEFWTPVSSILTESQFPQHFFSPILNLQKCVS